MAEKRTTKSEPAAEAEKQAQEAVGTETDRGFRGVEVDHTPNHAYTVAGVLAGEDVPEAAADPVAARLKASSD